MEILTSYELPYLSDEVQDIIENLSDKNEIENYKIELKNFKPTNDEELIKYDYLENLDFKYMTEFDFWKLYEQVFKKKGVKYKKARLIEAQKNGVINKLIPLETLDALEISECFLHTFFTYTQEDYFDGCFEDEKLRDCNNIIFAQSEDNAFDIQKLENLFGADNIKTVENSNYKNIILISCVTNFTNISYFKDLISLSLDWEMLDNISFIENLINITELNLCFNRIKDISPLKNLTNLTHLDLSSNNISDISSLTNLTKLTHLTLNSNNITDISFLRNLTNLTSLTLNSNNITDISSLRNLTNLTYLDLYHNPIQESDLEYFADILPVINND